MKFNSPEREKLGNGNPTWTTSSGLVALPQLAISPGEEDQWELTTWLAGRQVRREFDSIFSLLDFLVDWREHPEGACQRWFQKDPPTWLDVAPASPAQPSVLIEDSGDL